MTRMRAAGALLAAFVGVLGAVEAVAHEERLIAGRVERLDAARRVLVVADEARGERRRIELTAETEVLGCRAGGRLAAVAVGDRVRVKYVDAPGRVPEARAVLLTGR